MGRTLKKVWVEVGGVREGQEEQEPGNRVLRHLSVLGNRIRLEGEEALCSAQTWRADLVAFGQGSEGQGGGGSSSSSSSSSRYTPPPTHKPKRGRRPHAPLRLLEITMHHRTEFRHRKEYVSS